MLRNKIFKNGPSNICGKQPLRNLKNYGLLKQTILLQIFQRLPFTNFTWSILEYSVPYIPSYMRYIMTNIGNIPFDNLQQICSKSIITRHSTLKKSTPSRKEKKQTRKITLPFRRNKL